jgi:hypothetical protein
MAPQACLEEAGADYEMVRVCRDGYTVVEPEGCLALQPEGRIPALRVPRDADAVPEHWRTFDPGGPHLTRWLKARRRAVGLVEWAAQEDVDGAVGVAGDCVWVDRVEGDVAPVARQAGAGHDAVVTAERPVDLPDLRAGVGQVEPVGPAGTAHRGRRRSPTPSPAGPIPARAAPPVSESDNDPRS